MVPWVCCSPRAAVPRPLAAQERKKFVRAIKGDVAEVAHHPFGHMALVRLLDCTDDTVLLRKSILAELEPQLLDLACHVHGRKLFLHILAPKSRWYFPPVRAHLTVFSLPGLAPLC